MPEAFAHPSRPWRAAWLPHVAGRVLRYGLAGPPLGAAVYAVFLFGLGWREIASNPNESVASWLSSAILLGGPVFAVFGYVFGGVPALLAGAFAGWISWRGRRAWHLWAVAAWGAAVSAAFDALTHPAGGNPVVLAVCGAVSAGVCERWCRSADASARPQAVAPALPIRTP